MARPIKDIPPLRGREAKRFRKVFLTQSGPSAKRIEQNKEDMETYASASVVDYR